MADGNSLVPDSEAPRSARKLPVRSECWEHFERKGLKAECKYCKAMLCANPIKDGTSRLNKHYKKTCPVRHPKPGRQQQVLPGAPTQNAMHREQASTSKSGSDHLDQQKSAGEDQLITMIALHGYPSSLVEDVQFGKFVEFLCPGFKMPSRDDVEDRCDALFDDDMTKLKEALRCTPGQVSLSAGQAETTWGRVVYFAAHFIDGEWKLHRRVLQVLKPLDEYKPSYEVILKDYGQTDDKNSDRLMETISCWGLQHKVCSVLTEKTLDGKLEDNYLVQLFSTEYKLVCGTGICSELDFGISFNDFSMGESWLDAFQDLSQKKRRGISSRLRLNHPWRYGRWWYPCYYALEILHDEGTFQETELTELYRTTLGTTYRAMESLSTSSSPTSNLCLIELLNLRKKLHLEYSDDDGPCFHALDDVEKYLVVSYLPLSIPLVLDPRFKLTNVEQILKQADLDLCYISLVRVAVLCLFTQYSNQGNEMDGDPSQQGHPINREGQEQERERPSSQGSRTELDAYLQDETVTRNKKKFDILEWWKDNCGRYPELVAYLQDETVTTNQENFDIPEWWKGSCGRYPELEAYLQDETITRNQENFDILKWWKDNCGRYPTVARMARDFLAIPTSTRPSSQQITEIENHLRRYA